MSDNYEELQKKQLFAQRVTAASGVVTALAARRAAASLEEMRQEASIAAQATAEHQLEIQRLQRQQLALVEEEARSAAKEREYQRQVLFLKESDDSTKLEAYLEMLKAKSSSLYIVPDLPDECKEDGEITRRLKTVFASIPLSEEATNLKFEIEIVESKKTKIEAEEKSLSEGFACFIVFSVFFIIVAGLISIIFDLNVIVRYIIWGIPALLVFFLVIAKIGSAPEKQARQKRLHLLEEAKVRLDKEIQPFLDEALKKSNKAYAEGLDQWQWAVERAALQSFFDQGLWIEDDRFTERLKVKLTHIQKPFPTSCRTDVNNLRPDQITLAYQIFTDTVADLISDWSILGKDNDDKSRRKAELCPKILNILRSGPVSLEHEIREVEQAAMLREAETQREAAAEREAAAQRADFQREKEAQREADARQLAAASQRAIEEVLNKADTQRETTKLREIKKKERADAVQRNLNTYRDFVRHPVIIWICRILGPFGILGSISDAINSDDKGMENIIVGVLIFGSMTINGFWPKKKKKKEN